MKLLFTLIITGIMFLAMFAGTTQAEAQGPGRGRATDTITSRSGGEQSTDSPTTDLETSVTALNFFQKDIGSFITPLVETALIVGSILVLMYLLWGGIEWITSGGDKSKYEGARNRITAAILGLAIMASAWTIWLFINYFLGLDKVIKTSSQGSASSLGRQTQESSSSNQETQGSTPTYVRQLRGQETIDTPDTPANRYRLFEGD